ARLERRPAARLRCREPVVAARGILPMTMPRRQSHDLLAIAQDGAALLIGGLPAGGPRVVARLDIHALLDGCMAVADLDADGVPEAVVLSEPASRASQDGGSEGATSLAVIGLRPNGLDLRGRFSLPPPAVFEEHGRIQPGRDGS